MSKIRNAIAQLATYICTDDSHGYSQPNRLGDGTKSKYYLTSINKTVYVHGGDYDCSSMVWEILKVLNLIEPVDNFWTGNELEILEENNFEYVSLKELEVGDILWRRGHTEVYIGEDLTAGFVRSENYSIDGKKGDQDGGEGRIAEFNINEWRYALRYVGDLSELLEGENMVCIIKIIDSQSHWYFDSQKFHPLTEPEHLAMLDEIHKANDGKEMPRVYWSEDKFNRFFKFMK